MIAITPMLQVDDTLTDEEIRGMNEETKNNNGQAQAYDDHDCPIQSFLDDPITQHYGVGGEFLSSIHCYWCELERVAPPMRACCVCGSADIGYENYLGQLFCCPCADGSKP